MFRIRFFTLSKKVNSTKVPAQVDPSQIPTLYGEFIENTSFLSPQIRILKQGDIASYLLWPYKYNYCRIEFYSDNDENYYSRYFFITDWKWELGTWIITCQVDVLSTYKDLIGESSQYVLRAASQYDGAIEDSLYPVKADFETATYYTYDISHEGAQVPVWCDVDDLGQWYIVGVIANTGTLENLWDWVNPDLLANNNGSVVYLVLDQNQMFALIQMLLTDVSIYDISSQEVSLNLQKQLINPMQYIESIKLVPFKPNVVQDNGADKLLSKVPIGLNELDIPLSVTIKGTTVSIPGFRVLQRTSSYADLRPQQVFSNTGWISYHECRTKCYLHPQYDDRGKWVLGQPYSKYIIEVDPWGLIEVPGQSVLEAYKRTDLQGNPFFNIIYETWFDASTGACKLQISTEMESGASIPFYIDTAKISIDVPCHQSIQDVVGFKKTLMELAGAKVNYQTSIASAIGQVATFGLGSQATATAGAKVGATTGIIGGITKAASAATDWAVQEPVGIQTLQALNYPTISGSGSTGDTYMVQARDFASPRVHAYWTIICDDNIPDHGRPLCKIKRLDTLSGFIQCESAHMPTSSGMTVEEAQQIVAFLNGGFYYE